MHSLFGKCSQFAPKAYKGYLVPLIVYSAMMCPQIIASIALAQVYPAQTNHTKLYNVSESGAYYVDCTWNMTYYPLVLVLTPFVYMVLNFPLLFTTRRLMLEYEVLLLRFAIGGWFAFFMVYVSLIPLLLFLPLIQSISYEMITFALIPMVTGVIFYASAVLPVIYRLIKFPITNAEDRRLFLMRYEYRMVVQVQDTLFDALQVENCVE